MSDCGELSLSATVPSLSLTPGPQTLSLDAATVSRLTLTADTCSLSFDIETRLQFEVTSQSLSLTSSGIALQISCPIPVSVGRTADGLTLREPPALLVAVDPVATLSGLPPSIDGVNAGVDDRLLLTAQADARDNGLWVVKAGAWERPSDFVDGTFAAANFLFVQKGNQYADTGWLCTNDSGTDVVGTDDLAWTVFTSTGSAGLAGGDLDGSYPNPQVVAVTDEDGDRFAIADLTDGEFIFVQGGEVRSSAAGAWFEDVFTAAPGQTVFTLAAEPVDSESFQLTVNGVKYENDQYTLIGTTVTWLNVEFSMDGGETVLAKYINAFTVSAGSTELGVPSDGTYEEGLLPLTPNTTVADAIDAINEVLFAAVAPNAGLLDSTALVPSVTTYSAKLPSGLSAEWEPYVPGDTVTGLVVTATVSLATADPATRFNGGLFDNLPPGNRVYHVLDGSDADSRLVQDGVGSTGDVEITVDALYNTIWRRLNAQVNQTLTEGQSRHRIRADDAGQTDELRLYYDDVNDAPSFAVAPSVGVSVEVLRYLDGVAYYAEGTVLTVSYTAAVGIFRKHYHPSAVSDIAIPSAATVTKNPGSVPSFSASFGVTAEPLTLLSSGVAALTPQCSVTIRKAVGSLTSQVALARGHAAQQVYRDFLPA